MAEEETNDIVGPVSRKERRRRRTFIAQIVILSISMVTVLAGVILSNIGILLSGCITMAMTVGWTQLASD